jgi:ABC-type multidrug transport system fused ATPase/permease subunit
MFFLPTAAQAVKSSPRIDAFIKPVSLGAWASAFVLLGRMGRYYPQQLGLGLALNIVLAFVEIIGLTALLPLLVVLGIKSSGADQPADGLADQVAGVLAFLGIPMNLPVLLGLVFVLGLFIAVLRAASNIYEAVVSEELRCEAVGSVVNAMQQASWSSIMAEGRSGLFSAIQVESAYVGRVFAGNLKFFGSVIILLAYVGMALVVAWQLTLLLLVCGLLSAAFMRFAFKATAAAGAEIANNNRSRSPWLH